MACSLQVHHIHLDRFSKVTSSTQAGTDFEKSLLPLRTIWQNDRLRDCFSGKILTTPLTRNDAQRKVPLDHSLSGRRLA